MGKEGEVTGSPYHQTVLVDLCSLENAKGQLQCYRKELHGASAKHWWKGLEERKALRRFPVDGSWCSGLASNSEHRCCFVLFFCSAEKCSDKGYLEIKSCRCLIGAGLLRRKISEKRKSVMFFPPPFSIPQYCILYLWVKILSASNYSLLIFKII